MRFLSATGFLTNHPQSLYSSHSAELSEWWLGRESNPRHEDFQSSALPTELPSRFGEGKGLRKESGLTSGMVENVPRAQSRGRARL